MKNNPKKFIPAFLSLLTIPSTSFALNFSTAPAGTQSIEPAPNVIISVDDSGSMGEEGITDLKESLKDVFSENNIQDKRIRLAWQSMNRCNGIPSTSSACNGKNSMKVLDATHRNNFRTWIDTLKAEGGTPSHTMIINAGDYLSKSKESFKKESDWPWSEVPGVKVGNALGCRKSFHIFMTDGSWNSTGSTRIDADNNTSAYLAKSHENSANIDGTSFTLPDGKTYDSQSPQTKIYSDNWGGSSTYYHKNRSGNSHPNGDIYATHNNGSTQHTTSINTLSDLAFYYWSKDLQGHLSNEIKPIIKKSGNETLSKNGKSIEVEEYWNPKNNPATWQNLTTYTIGFKAAADWRISKNNKNQLLEWTGDNYGGSYLDIYLGYKKWPSPLCIISDKKFVPDIEGTYPCDGSSPYSTHNEIGNRRTELWHMALNSRGKFFPATDGAALKNAFNEILTTIVEDTSTPIAGIASASGSISTQDTTAYISAYSSDGWQGGIYSQKVAENTGVLSNNTAWGIQANGQATTTADKLNSLSENDISNRLILSAKDNNDTTPIAFTYENLSDTQKSAIRARKTGGNTTSLNNFGNATVNFIRGNRSNEGNTVEQVSLRKRMSRQGDIVNSTIWYTGAPNQGYNYNGYGKFTSDNKHRILMLYIGGNDGMLHGFNATNGSEKIAYIPKGVIPNLHHLTDPNYVHRYYVEGSPFTGDVDIGTAETPDWRTMLVGTLGAGGKGYFVLDVTKPGTISGKTPSVSSNFSASNASTLVVMDKTWHRTDTSADADIGHVFAEPTVNEFNRQISTQIARLNNGRWAVIMGNGYNSTNGNPVLLIQYLDGNKSLIKLHAASSGAESSENGLSAPRSLDVDGDGSPDFVYAGDLKGNMWKFDISSNEPSNWGVAFNGSPLFTAIHQSGNSSSRQPITTAPLLRAARTTKGLMVAFGTGRNLTDGDRSDESHQTFYSIVDNTQYVIASEGSDKGKVTTAPNTTPSTVSSSRSELIERSFNTTAIAGEDISFGQTFWNMGTQSKIDYADGNKGWYFDFPEDGERTIRPPRFWVAGSNVIEILSDKPAIGGSDEGESCEPTSTPALAWRTLLGIELGERPNQQLLDSNGDGLYSSSLDQNTNRMTARPKELALEAKGEQVRISPEGTTRGNELSRPVSTVNWRQMQ